MEDLPIFVGYSQLNHTWAFLCMCRKTMTKLICVGYSQLNSTTVLDFFAPDMYDTSLLNMQHLYAGHIFFCSDSSFREIPAILYNISITTDNLE